MIRFRVNEFEIELDPSTLLVPQFYALLHSDKSAEKKVGLGCLMLVFYLCELNMTLNPYAEQPIEERENYVRRILFKEIGNPTKAQEKLILEAREEYHRCNYNSLWATIATNDREIFFLNDLLRTEAATMKNAEERVNLQLKIEKLTQARERTRMVALQEEDKARNRGNVMLSILEDRGVKLDPTKLPKRKRVEDHLTAVKK